MYYYRFLRTKNNGLHNSELNHEIEFYTSNECGEQRDFLINPPVVKRMNSKQDVQLLFGADSLTNAIKVRKLFCYKHQLLGRFKLSSIPSEFQISMHDDMQFNPGSGSKYIMSDFNESKIVIPDSEVQVLSTCGWVSKANCANILNKIKRLDDSKYDHLISNA